LVIVVGGATATGRVKKDVKIKGQLA